MKANHLVPTREEVLGGLIDGNLGKNGCWRHVHGCHSRNTTPRTASLPGILALQTSPQILSPSRNSIQPSTASFSLPCASHNGSLGALSCPLPIPQVHQLVHIDGRLFLLVRDFAAGVRLGGGGVACVGDFTRLIRCGSGFGHLCLEPSKYVDRNYAVSGGAGDEGR